VGVVIGRLVSGDFVVQVKTPTTPASPRAEHPATTMAG